MGVAGQRQRPGLRVALAQGAQALAQEIGGGGYAVRGLEPGRIGREVGGQLPDPLHLPAGRDAGDVGQGGGRPVELGHRVLGGGEERRDDLVAGEHLGGVGDLVEQEGELGELGVDSDQAGAGEAGVAVRHAEGQAGDHLGADGEAAGLEREALVVGVEAEGVVAAVGVGDAQQPLAAEVDVEPGLLERPVGRDLDAVEGEGDDAVAGRPGGAMGEGGVVEGPAFERDARADRPEVELLEATPQAFDALLVGQRHDGSFSRRSRSGRDG